MKNLPFYQIAGAVVALLLPGSARAQCLEQVLSPPTLDSLQVRTVSVEDVCNFAYGAGVPTGDPCVNGSWLAASFIPTPGAGSGMEVRFAFEIIDTCNEIVYAQAVRVLTIPQSFLDAHPQGFAISIAQQLPSGEGVEWSFVDRGPQPSPSLVFEGVVTVGQSGFIADVTFTGGRPGPAGAIEDLIAVISASGQIEEGTEQALIATLEAALAALESGNPDPAANHIEAFMNKVNSARGKKIPVTLADELIASAQAILNLLE